MTLMIFSMMKKIKLTLLALCAVALTGCGNKNDRESVSGTNTLETVEYNGHRYIMYQGMNKGSITHDPDCPCREKGGEE